METRANHVWVGAVTLLLLAALALFIVWIAGLGENDRKEYDIFFKQSVAGLANGSSVSFAGVPVGQGRDISLWDTDPEFVRVRIVPPPPCKALSPASRPSCSTARARGVHRSPAKPPRAPKARR